MPYSGAGDDKLPENVKKMSDGDRAQWVSVFNSAYSKCTEVGNDTGACEEDAFKIANGVVSGEKRMDVKEIWERIKSLFAPMIDEPPAEREYRIDLPTQTRSLVVTRAADGTRRWMMIAASAVINKVGAIDSTALFDSFIAKAPRVGYPVLDFLHECERIRFGVADWLYRDGPLYLASGTFDDTELARAAADGLEKQPGYWGASIKYNITAPPTILVAEGEIPVYTDGINTFISIVPKRMAANLFTATSVAGEVERMNQVGFDELVKLVGAERAAQFAGEVDDASRTIEESGMVTRAEASPEAPPATPESEPPVVEARAEEVRAPEAPPQASAEGPSLADVVAKINEMDARLAKLEQGGAGAVEESQRAVTAMDDLTTRLAAVEASKKRWDNWLSDAPEHIRAEADNVYRARNQADTPPTMAQIAATTTANMNKRPR